MWSVAVVNLGDLSQTAKCIQPLACVLVHLHVGCDERSHQPRPDCPLVISRIAADYTAFISSAVLRVARGEAAQTERSQKLPLDDRDDLLRAGLLQHRVRKADCKDLVGPDGGVSVVSVHDVIEATRFLIPELAVEARAGAV